MLALTFPLNTPQKLTCNSTGGLHSAYIESQHGEISQDIKGYSVATV
jgi:hypothetical protein